MKKIVIRTLAVLIPLLVLLLVVEISARWVYYQQGSPYPFAIKQLTKEWGKKQKGEKFPVPDEYRFYLNSDEEIKNLTPVFLKDGIAFGNSPFQELRNDKTEAQFRDDKGVLRNKPNYHYAVSFLKSRVGEQWDPYLYKDSTPDAPKSPETLDFINRYGLAFKHSQIDADGNRVTVPASTATDIILVVGDSVAYGAAIDDAETLPSVLQRQHPQFKFVNASVGGGHTTDNFQRLRERLAKHKGHVKGVVYVNTETGFSETETPEFIVNGLDEILEKEVVLHRVFVNAQYVYIIMPDMLRKREEKDLRKFLLWRKQTLALAHEKNMLVVDAYEIVNDYRQKMGTPYAGFSFFVDHSHFSLFGSQKVAEHIRFQSCPMAGQTTGL